MVIWFNVKKARDFLLKNGYVYTLRPRKRREGIEVLMYDGFGKKGVVNVSFVKEIKSDKELYKFVNESGFYSIQEWRKEAGDSKFLYFVTLLE